ncbi:hypothetical protein [Streptomyces sp. NPDC005244]|uniref:hypothetical protein n=1 Tax=Streptomyces sp. NPDC005244 TaxID=3364708 RepID=UPI00368D207D
MRRLAHEPHAEVSVHIKPLRASLDNSGLAHIPPTPLPASSTVATRPVQGDTMAINLGDRVTVTEGEMREVLARFQPYWPSYLLTIEPAPFSGLRYTFAPFTGREAEPSRPEASYDDPALAHVWEADDPVEHKLRTGARTILREVFQQALLKWRDAAFVADLKAVIKDAPVRWQAYERELKATESAYAYLRTAEAGREWPAAVCRLVDAHNRLTAAATAFEERGRQIAYVNEKHLYADLGWAPALERAGHPEGRAWLVGGAYEGRYDAYLTDQVRRLIEQQQEFVARVGRLSGMPTT